MFGSLGDLANVIRQAGQLQQNLAKMQEELAQKSFDAEAGAGLVKAVVNGRGELVDLKIEAKAVQDIELLEELVKGAVGAAMRKAQQGAKEEFSKLTGGMSLPGLEQMLGGGA